MTFLGDIYLLLFVIFSNKTNSNDIMARIFLLVD